MTTSKLDMTYGRQGGRIVPWTATDPDVPRCVDCRRALLRAEIAPGRCAECTPDDGQLALL